MNYEQMQIAVLDAHRRGDPAQCFDLLDRFLDEARGGDLGKALCLKAACLMRFDKRRCVEGLVLLEEALPLLAEDPVDQMRCAIEGVGLCYTTGDVQRSVKYEVLGHHILRTHGDLQAISSLYPRLSYNLAHIASLKKEHTQAYWHLVQGSRALSASPDDSQDTRCLRFVYELRIAEVCLEMNRSPEALEALTRARAWMGAQGDEPDWTIHWASYLLATGKEAAGAQALDELADVCSGLRPTDRVRYHLVRSQIALALGDVRSFHCQLEEARKGALEHGLDHMLCRIQRVMRTPVTLEAVK